MALQITILGCGSSGGVPRIGNDWGACDPSEPKNRRRRCSILVERKNAQTGGKTRVLVDTSPDLREQFLDAGICWVDGVLFTHDHADQTHGIDDLRPAIFKAKRQIDMYMNDETRNVLTKRFGYIFKTPPGSSYPPIAKLHIIKKLQSLVIDGPGGAVEALPFEQDHGQITSLGFRFDDFAYVNDLVGLPDESLAQLENLDLIIVDALRYASHPTHFNVEQALELVKLLKPRQAVLTNMHIDLDYKTLAHDLPKGVKPAFDGMVLESS